MTKTNWQDRGTGEIRSTDISGLQEAVGKIEESIGIDSIAETNIPLTEVYISDGDRYRIFQAPIGKRNWTLSPALIIKKNGVVISTGFEIDYGGGAIILNVNDSALNSYTVDATYTKKIDGKQLSTEDFTTGQKIELVNLRIALTSLEYSELSSIASGIDGEGIYTIITWKRKDNTVYAMSTLLDTSPSYNQVKIEYYNDAGTTIIKTILWNITYDENEFPYTRMVV